MTSVVASSNWKVTRHWVITIFIICSIGSIGRFVANFKNSRMTIMD